MSYADPNEWLGSDPGPDGKLAAYVILGALAVLLFAKAAGIL